MTFFLQKDVFTKAMCVKFHKKLNAIEVAMSIDNITCHRPAHEMAAQ